jgi:hypothetical protein
MDEIPKHVIIARAIQTINRGDISREWKNEHFDIILYAEDKFKDPSRINPEIENGEFREGVRRITTLSKYLGNEIRNTQTFDSEVFKLLCKQILDCINLTEDDDTLCESMQYVTL